MSWFPLAEELMEDAIFRALGPLDKLYYWALISKANQYGGKFYWSDLEAAATLGCSLSTVRGARRKYTKLGWISTIPGFRDKRGRTLATQYQEVKWAQVEGVSWYAQMHRHTFDMMLNRLWHKVFQPGDLVVYIYLSYWQCRCQVSYEESGDFFITRRQLRELTGLEDAPLRVARLYNNFTYNGGAHLFEYSGYQKLKFTKWATAADPEKDENNRQHAERYLREIKERARQLRQEQTRREKGIAPQDLPEIFRRLYKQKYGRALRIRRDTGAWELLEKNGERYGADKVYQAMMFYFNASQVPITLPVSTRTISNFLTNIGELVRRAESRRIG